MGCCDDVSFRALRCRLRLLFVAQVIATMIRVLIAVVLVVSVSACATNREHARFDPSRDIHASDTFFVERVDGKKRNLDRLIVDNLAARGMAASVGTIRDMPEGTSILVTYDDRWSWDITTFLIEMTITFRDPDTRGAFAIGTSYHTSMSRLNPAEMIDEIISNLIAADNDQDGVIELDDRGSR